MATSTNRCPHAGNGGSGASAPEAVGRRERPVWVGSGGLIAVTERSAIGALEPLILPEAPDRRGGYALRVTRFRGRQIPGKRLKLYGFPGFFNLVLIFMCLAVFRTAYAVTAREQARREALEGSPILG